MKFSFNNYSINKLKEYLQMQPGELFSQTGKRIDYLYKHLDRDVRGSFMSAGILQKAKDSTSNNSNIVNSEVKNGPSSGTTNHKINLLKVNTLKKE